MFLPLRDVNPTRAVPFVSYALLFANVLAFVWMAAQVTNGADWIVPQFGLVPARLVDNPAAGLPTVFSSMFLHGSLAHLASNMLFLHIFGDNVEDVLGHGRFLLFYVVCGLAAAAAQVLIDPASTVPMVGASGAIAGVVGGYLVLYPRAPIFTFNSVFPLWFVMGVFPVVPAWLVAGEFFLVNLLQGLGSLGMKMQGGIAFFAHLGGFVAGLVLVRPWAVRRPELQPWRGFRHDFGGRGSRRRRRW